VRAAMSESQPSNDDAGPAPKSMNPNGRPSASHRRLSVTTIGDGAVEARSPGPESSTCTKRGEFGDPVVTDVVVVRHPFERKFLASSDHPGISLIPNEDQNTENDESGVRVPHARCAENCR
jgi:hypothetical protein